jgi:hypothetical protein
MARDLLAHRALGAPSMCLFTGVNLESDLFPA